MVDLTSMFTKTNEFEKFSTKSLDFCMWDCYISRRLE